MFGKLKAEIAKKASAAELANVTEQLVGALKLQQQTITTQQALLELIGKLDKRTDSAISKLLTSFDRLSRDVDACKKKLDPTSHGPSIYAIIEDLRARMPKGSAVSDYRFDELVAKVARLQKQLDEINCAFQNAKNAHEQAAAELEHDRRNRVAVKRVEAKALPE
jgi:outer membrane murein-binding lipoprotein Lpp